MNLSAVLLAGGESRRMGQDKATLEFRGGPLWQRQLELLDQLNLVEVSSRRELIHRGGRYRQSLLPTKLLHAAH